MAPGPRPKPAHLRQRTNRKAGASVLLLPAAGGVPVPDLPPHPLGTAWHPYTLESWGRVWTSAMASKWLPSEFDGVFRMAILWDGFYRTGRATDLAEIRQQEQRFGLSPLDRSRLQWEILRTDEAERKHPAPPKKTGIRDPRAYLTAIK